jgi:hypothetical protein
MPVNEMPPEPEPTLADRLAIRSRAAIGASDRMPVRVILLFVLTGVCVTLAPIPANLLGVAALSLLALDTSLHRR